MDKWTIKQLKFADEVCFPADFRKLWNKHGDGNVLENINFKEHGGLIGWIFSKSRANMDRFYNEPINNILKELIKDYS